MSAGVISIWGDSIGKGITYDEARGRHIICRENYETTLKGEGFEVHNYARMGCTAVMGEALMTGDRMKGDIALIEFGGNDSDIDWKAVSADETGDIQPALVSIPDFRAALTRMIERARSFSLKPILVTPLPVAAGRYFEWVSKGLDRDRILKYLGGSAEYIYRWQERYDRALLDVAARENTPVFDIRSRFLDEKNLGDVMSIDGIHPNPKGYAIIRETLIAQLARLGF